MEKKAPQATLASSILGRLNVLASLDLMQLSRHGSAAAGSRLRREEAKAEEGRGASGNARTGSVTQCMIPNAVRKHHATRHS